MLGNGFPRVFNAPPLSSHIFLAIAALVAQIADFFKCFVSKF
jgi:hypothetical protein